MFILIKIYYFVVYICNYYKYKMTFLFDNMLP